jgi:speckle-type POZ protein
MYMPGGININHTVLNPNAANAWGCGKFIERSQLQASPWSYLSGDRLAIECYLSVVVGSRVSGPESETAACAYEIQMPPPENRGRLLLEIKEAHKIVLAARSPVFKAELYGFIGGKKNEQNHLVTIQDMEPSVFNALLHFIYTDSLPAANDDCDLNDEGVVKHLLVAADRYGENYLFGTRKNQSFF